jgi:hypothetical protein
MDGKVQEHLAGVEDLAEADRRPFLGLCFKNLGICELPHIGATKKYANPLSASSTRRRGDANARMDGSGNRRRGRDWPDLVGRRDVELGPRGRLGFGRDIAACRVIRHWLMLRT